MARVSKILSVAALLAGGALRVVEVDARARKAGVSVEDLHRAGPVQVARGTVLSVHLRIDGLIVSDEPNERVAQANGGNPP